MTTSFRLLLICPLICCWFCTLARADNQAVAATGTAVGRAWLESDLPYYRDQTEWLTQGVWTTELAFTEATDSQRRAAQGDWSEADFRPVGTVRFATFFTEQRKAPAESDATEATWRLSDDWVDSIHGGAGAGLEVIVSALEAVPQRDGSERQINREARFRLGGGWLGLDTVDTDMDDFQVGRLRAAGGSSRGVLASLPADLVRRVPATVAEHDAAVERDADHHTWLLANVPGAAFYADFVGVYGLTERMEGIFPVGSNSAGDPERCRVTLGRDGTFELLFAQRTSTGRDGEIREKVVKGELANIVRRGDASGESPTLGYQTSPVTAEEKDAAIGDFILTFDTGEGKELAYLVVTPSAPSSPGGDKAEGQRAVAYQIGQHLANRTWHGGGPTHWNSPGSFLPKLASP